jgi:hypothetical protein
MEQCASIKKSSEQISQINIICAMHENTTYNPFSKAKYSMWFLQPELLHSDIICYHGKNIDTMVKK